MESEVGKGTSAHIWLPLSHDNESEAPAAVEVLDAAPGVRHRILVVDDDAIILMNTAALLEDLGHQVIEADSGEEALEAIRSHPDIGILITDQAMPGMTGSELIAAARVERPDLPVILATGYGETPNDLGLGLHRLGKPFGQKDLERALAAVTD